MLAIPQAGVSASVKKHNCGLDTLADWVEATLLFGKESSVSASAIVDILTEEEIYTEQSFAWEMVDNVWTELARRSKCIGIGNSYKVKGQRIFRHAKWQDSPAHAFCLVLALAKWYPAWAKTFGHDYNVQGQLFEQFSMSALARIMPDWQIQKTGWSAKAAKKIHEIIPIVAKSLGEKANDPTPWVNAQANEAGLDVLCFRPLNDSRPGIPAMMIQCASGLDYHAKAETPNLKEWGKMLNGFIATPKRALTTPFAFEEGEFVQICNRVDGPLFDRCRLLSASCKGDAKLQNQLAKALIAWTKPRIAKLPSAN